ncbi:hypothetical protein RIF29_22108 [Crotalaria pallida]|uniref:Pectinesterase n=1 Tax=Crotalaria pallida TaxID=3830 RepID=A0AAN9F411_CROPI
MSSSWGVVENRNKRIAIISISTFLLVAMVMAISIAMNINHKENGSKYDNNNKTHPASTMKVVNTLCQPTNYKKECVESLKAEANTTDTRELIGIAFNITIRKIGNGLKKTNLMHEVEKDHDTKMALDTCKQLMDLSINEFTRSIDRMGRLFDINDFDNILTSLKVWLSGAITYQETCLDGFENTTSEAGEKMKGVLKTSMHMSSNALAIITELSKTLDDLNGSNAGRRLLQDSDDEGEEILDHEDLLSPWFDGGVGGFRRLLHSSSHRRLKPNVAVAKDGSGKFKSINEALKHVPKKNQRPFIIYIKEGVYHEYVEVTKQMTHVVFVGDGGNKTRISGNKNFIDGVNTYRTSTVVVQGDYFVAMNVGFENSAGPHKHQAVAIRVQADKSIFYRCKIDGYQNTLYAHTHRQFYRDCTISGTIDFVFGDAVAVFQNCTFVVRKPLENQKCIVTAQGRTERNQPSGIVIQGGSIVSSPEYHVVRHNHRAYLAQPYKNYSRTIFMDNYIDDFIQSDGYYMPRQQGPKDTCFYAEYNNTGPGSNKSKRVKWNGIKTLTSQSANSFLPYMFFHGDNWIKVTRIPYSSGMTEPKH